MAAIRPLKWIPWPAGPAVERLWSVTRFLEIVPEEPCRLDAQTLAAFWIVGDTACADAIVSASL